MDYKEAWNDLNGYIRERLRYLTRVKDSGVFSDSPLAPADDGVIEMRKKTIAFIEDAERNRKSRGMNYKELWSSLRGFLTLNRVTNSVISMWSEVDSEERLHANGAKSAATAILDQMEMIEKEMTTVRDDDGQSAQD